MRWYRHVGWVIGIVLVAGAAWSTRANLIERVSVDSTGTEATGSGRDPALSADGRFVAFESDTTNLRLPR